MKRDPRNLPYVYDGKTAVIDNVAGDFCESCGEVILDATEAARVCDLMLANDRKEDAEHMDPTRDRLEV